MAVVAGLRGTGDFGQDELPGSFREMIMMMGYTGSAPMFALTAKAKKSSCADPEFNWWCESQGIYRMQVNGALGTTEEIITIDSVDPGAGTERIAYGSASHCIPGDILMVEPATDTAVFAPEKLEVVSVLSATKILVRRGAVGTIAANIADNAMILNIGPAFAEGSGLPTSVSRNPTKYSNYLQIWKHVYELTEGAALVNTRTGDPVANDKKRKMFDHSLAIEWGLIFGQKYETVGENGKPKRFTNGLRAMLPQDNVTIFNGPVSTFDLLDAISPLFDMVTQAGNTRIGFCGNGTLNEINKIIQSSGELSWGDTIKTYNLNLRELKFPQGQLYLTTHPLFSQHKQITGSGTFNLNHSMLLVDFSALTWRFRTGRDTKFKDNIQLPGEDVRRGFWLTEGGLMVDYGGQTCGWLGNVSCL